MPDDKAISELISQSMRKDLSKDEQEKINESVGQNVESQKFAALSKQIHESVSGLNVDGEPNSKAKLSDDVRKRLSESVAAAVKEKLSLSQAGLIAQSSTPLGQPGTSRTSGTHQTDSTRTYSEEEFKEVVIRYQCVRKLAAGSSGQVWIARDEKLGRTVVIKELNSVAKASPQAWDRFQREAEITGLLEHPNIVPLYMYGTDQRTGEPFYAMRYVGQRNLANSIQEHHDRVEAGQAGNLSLHRLLNTFLDICQAIAYAHSRGVIHRDLKPDNVAIDNFGQVVVLDWGLAKVMDESELALKMNDNCIMTDSSLMRTSHGEFIGTPVYMSPEQAAGKIELIDTRTDIYCLGGILFSMLTGRAPHDSVASESNSKLSDVIMKIAEATTPLPSDYSAVPSDLEAICVRAMSRKRHLRFDSATELAEVVEQWMIGQSTKKINYEKLRMEGRELRADLQAKVHDLERNVSFCSGLPPVQELINAETEDDEKVWRKRMSTILIGLMKANPSYQSFAFGRFEGDSYTEIVRVEKQKEPADAVRTIPKGRLETRKKNDFLQKLSAGLPGELLTSLVHQSDCVAGSPQVELQSGIPIYDSETEEVFGFMVISCNIYQLLQKQLRRCQSAGEISVACDTHNIMSQLTAGKLNEESRGKTLSEIVPNLQHVVDHLQTNLEFIDDANSEVYGARIWFDPNSSGLMFLLKY